MRDHPFSEERDHDVAPPHAAAIAESLRAFGYDLPTALADLIDNSITAGAQRVWLRFHWNGANSVIALRDDGRGMVEEELVAAMRPGSRSPVEERLPTDLGRFGLGLKTASFSQCRVVTVRSRQTGAEAATRCWDLDYVAQHNDWFLLRRPSPGSESFLDELATTGSGTAVVWQRLDRLIGNAAANDAVAQNHFYAAIDDVKLHLAMTFHDRLTKPSGTGSHTPLKIFINGHPLVGWDPFLSHHVATQLLPEERFHHNGYEVIVRPYILPHHDRLTPDELKDAGGRHGWNAHQGFYILRNRRLIVAGGWLGLPLGKEDRFKLARIRVDLPNSADADWQLDVKKSTAQPPPDLRMKLKRTAIATRSRACDVYRHRGAKLLPKAGVPKIHLWEQDVRRGKIVYSLNDQHPLIQSVIDNSKNQDTVRALLKLIEETVPVPLIAFNTAEQPQNHAAPFEQVPYSQIQSVMKQVYNALCEAGHPPNEARRQLMRMDAFEQFPELISALDSGVEIDPDAEDKMDQEVIL